MAGAKYNTVHLIIYPGEGVEQSRRGSMNGIGEEEEDHRDMRDPTPNELDDLAEPLCTAR